MMYSQIKFIYSSRYSFSCTGMSQMKNGISILLSSCTFFMLFGYSQTYAGSVFGPPNPGPPSPAPATSTTTTVFSSSVHPPGGSASSSTAPQFSGMVVPSNPLTLQQYATLPTCPSNPVCPDINGNLPAGTTKNCPSYCTVTRQDIIRTVGSNTVIDSSTPAICPSNYVA